MSFRSACLCTLAIACASHFAWAGGSGFNVAVVVNQNSSNSVQLANLYCELRGVPPQNVLNLNYNWSGGSINCTQAEFQNQLVAPLLAMLQSRNLTNQIQFVLLSMDIPYRVNGTNGCNSTTSALFYGFKPDGPPPTGLPVSCALPDNSSNSYAFSETAFADSPPDTAATNAFLAVMLTDANLASAETILRNAVAADGTFPGQGILLEKTTDPARDVRFYEFDNAITEMNLAGSYAVTNGSSNDTSETNLLGFETGLTTFAIPTNAYVPGAIADNLTSYGGCIFDPHGQSVLLEFLDGGAAVSYGTVIEPCNYLQKFPNPLDYFYQLRGFSIAEAYYQSLQNPYQGIMVGEPLAAPFALPGAGSWQLPLGLATLSALTNLQINFSAVSSNNPLGRVDLFVDGTWLKTLTNLPPAAGDTLSVKLNGATINYSLSSLARIGGGSSGLAAALNAASNTTHVQATGYGDRLDLRSLNSSAPGVSLTAQASVTNTSGNPTALAHTALPYFFDTSAKGFHNILISNTPSIGSWMQLQVVETNGGAYTFGVTNSTSGTTIGQMLLTLYYEIYNTPGLGPPTGFYPEEFDDESPYGFADFNIFAQSPGWPASAIQVEFTSSPDLLVQAPQTTFLQDNLSDLQPRNQLYLASGLTSLPVSFQLDTTLLADGYHELSAVAYEGDSVRTQTRATQSVLIQNTGMSATLNTLYGGSNTDISATLQFAVAVNTNGVGTIQLFGTGGVLGTVTNQNTANFAVPGSGLGLGLHPFYAVVTAGNGRQYRTATTWIRLIGPEPPIHLSIAGAPLMLQWQATAGRAYTVESAPSAAGPFTNFATVVPATSSATWAIPGNSGTPRYFLLKTSH